MLTAIFLRVVAVYLAISIFNCINFVRAADTLMGRKTPWTCRKLWVVIKFGFALKKSIFHWLLDWYIGLTNPMKMVELMSGGKVRS